MLERKSIEPSKDILTIIMDWKRTAEDPKPLPKIHISNFNKNCHSDVIGQSGHQTTSSILDGTKAPAERPNNVGPTIYLGESNWPDICIQFFQGLDVNQCTAVTEYLNTEYVNTEYWEYWILNTDGNAVYPDWEHGSWMLISDRIPDHCLLSSCNSNNYELRNRLPSFTFALCSLQNVHIC